MACAGRIDHPGRANVSDTPPNASLTRMPHDAATSPGRMAPKAAARLTARTVGLAIAVAGTLVLAKAAAFWASGSIAVLSSLADSGLDLAASLLTLAAVRYAAVPADEEHRFGHGKAEAFAGLMQATLVTVAAVLVGREAIERLITPQNLEANAWSIAVMVLSIVLTSALVWAQTRALKENGSVAVAGDRAHYMADLASNAVILGGIVIAGVVGVRWVDPLVGLAVAAWLLKSAWDVAQGALAQIMDRELDEADRDRIKRLAEGAVGVLAVHDLRTRAAGPMIHVQMHVELEPHLTLAEAHAYMVDAERRIRSAYPGADVLIHPDPRGAAEPHGNPHLAPPDAGPEHDADDADKASEDASEAGRTAA